MNNNTTKVTTGPNTRWSYTNVWEAKSINGATNCAYSSYSFSSTSSYVLPKYLYFSFKLGAEESVSAPGQIISSGFCLVSDYIL